MNKLYPNAVARRVWQITPQLLNSWGVKGLILDIDNTLTTHNNPIPEPQVAQWLEGNRRAVWTGRQLGQLSGDGLPKDRAGAGIYPPDGSGRL